MVPLQALPWFGSPWAVLPVELLHGITFACGWGAGTINCKRIAPPGLGATMQVRQNPSAHVLNPVAPDPRPQEAGSTRA